MEAKEDAIFGSSRLARLEEELVAACAAATDLAGRSGADGAALTSSFGAALAAYVAEARALDRRDVIGKALRCSRAIGDGRTVRDVHAWLHKEVAELDEEVAGKGGVDGIAGEAADVMLCALDEAFVSRPDLDEDAMADIVLAKCRKWFKQYGPDGASRRVPTAAPEGSTPRSDP